MLCLRNSCPGTARPLQQSTSSTRSRRLRELPNNLPGASSTGAMGRMPLAFRNSNTSLPNLPSRSNRMYQKGQKRKSLVQLLHDRIARRVCRNIEVQASPSIVRNDKKAVEGAETWGPTGRFLPFSRGNVSPRISGAVPSGLSSLLLRLPRTYVRGYPSGLGSTHMHVSPHGQSQDLFHSKNPNSCDEQPLPRISERASLTYARRLSRQVLRHSPSELLSARS